MKYTIILFIFILASCQKKEANPETAAHIPSRVDSLATAEDVSAYLRLADTNFNGFRLKPMKNFRFANDDRKEYERLIRTLANDLNVDKSFYKADFDNNGYTDMVVTGDFYHDKADPKAFGTAEVYVVLNSGKLHARICRLNHPYFSEVLVPEIETKGSETLIRLHTVARKKSKVKADTMSTLLTGRFGYFAEYNAAPPVHTIEKIQYDAEPCHGKCPTFEITINSDRSAWFIAQSFNFSGIRRGIDDIEGVYKTTLSQADYDRITAFINYLDFPSLEDNYSFPQFHLPGAKLIITYDGGKTKTISDYGRIGTYGLRGLYKMMEDLRFNQNWGKTEEPEGLRISQY